MKKLTGLQVIEQITACTKELNATGLIREHVADGGFERWWQGRLLDHFVLDQERSAEIEENGGFGVRTEVVRPCGNTELDRLDNKIDLMVRASLKQKSYHYIELKLMSNGTKRARSTATKSTVNDIVGLLTVLADDIVSAWQCVLAYDFDDRKDVDHWAGDVYREVCSRGHELDPQYEVINLPNRLQQGGGRIYLVVFRVQ